MTTNQQRALDIIANSEITLLGPDGLIERKTIYGVHGDEDDFAVSLAWRDADGNEWEADFTEESLAQAIFEGNSIILVDSLGQQVTLSAMKLTAVNV